LLVIGLGITWILDGLEVTIVGAIGPVLQSAETLHLSTAQLGAAASFYVLGAVAGALLSGWITDRWVAASSSSSPCASILREFY
jgi:MFS family permease